MQPNEDAFDRTERRRAEHEAAARDFGHIIFGPPETESPKAKEDPVGSADAGEHGKVEPENRRAPAEHLADILLRGEGVPADPWRRG